MPAQIVGLAGALLITTEVKGVILKVTEAVAVQPPDKFVVVTVYVFVLPVTFEAKGFEMVVLLRKVDGLQLNPIVGAGLPIVIM